MTDAEKLQLVFSLNWDYNISPSDILEVIEGKRSTAGVFTREKLFARSIQVLKWQNVVRLWGIDNCKALMKSCPDIRRMLIPQVRNNYDYIQAILLGKPVPAPEQSFTNTKGIPSALLSNRRYRFEQGLS